MDNSYLRVQFPVFYKNMLDFLNFDINTVRIKSKTLMTDQYFDSYAGLRYEILKKEAQTCFNMTNKLGDAGFTNEPLNSLTRESFTALYGASQNQTIRLIRELKRNYTIVDNSTMEQIREKLTPSRIERVSCNIPDLPEIRFIPEKINENTHVIDLSAQDFFAAKKLMNYINIANFEKIQKAQAFVDLLEEPLVDVSEAHQNIYFQLLEIKDRAKGLEIIRSFEDLKSMITLPENVTEETLQTVSSQIDQNYQTVAQFVLEKMPHVLHNSGEGLIRRTTSVLQGYPTSLEREKAQTFVQKLSQNQLNPEDLTVQDIYVMKELIKFLPEIQPIEKIIQQIPQPTSIPTPAIETQLQYFINTLDIDVKEHMITNFEPFQKLVNSEFQIKPELHLNNLTAEYKGVWQCLTNTIGYIFWENESQTYFDICESKLYQDIMTIKNNIPSKKFQYILDRYPDFFNKYSDIKNASFLELREEFIANPSRFICKIDPIIQTQNKIESLDGGTSPALKTAVDYLGISNKLLQNMDLTTCDPLASTFKPEHIEMLTSLPPLFS